MADDGGPGTPGHRRRRRGHRADLRPGAGAGRAPGHGADGGPGRRRRRPPSPPRSGSPTGPRRPTPCCAGRPTSLDGLRRARGRSRHRRRAAPGTVVHRDAGAGPVVGAGRDRAPAGDGRRAAARAFPRERAAPCRSSTWAGTWRGCATSAARPASRSSRGAGRARSPRCPATSSWWPPGWGPGRCSATTPASPVQGQVVRLADPGRRPAGCSTRTTRPASPTSCRAARDVVSAAPRSTAPPAPSPTRPSSAAVLDAGCALVPALRGAPVLSRAVGLRPGRPTVRLDRTRRRRPAGHRLLRARRRRRHPLVGLRGRRRALGLDVLTRDVGRGRVTTGSD